MRYEILGPLRVIDGGDVSFIGAPKIETLLVALLIRTEQVVSFDQLITEIWGRRPPRRASAGLHVYVSRLRKLLSRPERPASAIVTRPRGYVFHAGSDELDLREFRRTMDLGRADVRADRHERAVVHFETALELLRGPVLDEAPHGPIVDGFVTWLSEARLECAELLVESQLALSRHREVVGRLSSLTAEHPLHEAFYRQLMLALYRSQRQADALKVYQAARRALNEQLGLEPCRELRELQQAILTDDGRLEACA
jgi:DNA-binding SARP family transcriptional activator